MTVEARDSDEIRATFVDVLEDLLDDPATDDIDILGAISSATSDVIRESELKLDDLSDEAFLISATGEQLDNKAREFGVIRQEAIRASGVVEFSRESAASTDFTIPEGTRVETADGAITFETTEDATLEEGEAEVKVNVRAQESGVSGNLPAQKLISMPSPPTGIERVENLIPTGDPDFEDTDDNSLIAGEDRETDIELRERALDSTNVGGTATASSVTAALRRLEGVRSVTTYINRDDEEDERGLPPYSSEILVTGGTDSAIAEALMETMAGTDLLRTQGGIIGDGVSVTKHFSPLDQDVEINFARPMPIHIEIAVDLKAMDTYEGENTVKNSCVEYVGGTLTDGSNAEGRDAGENVVISRIRNVIIGEDNGVEGIASLDVIATDDDGNDVPIETIDSIEQIPIDNNEQATIEASDVVISEV